MGTLSGTKKLSEMRIVKWDGGHIDIDFETPYASTRFADY